MKKLIFKRIPIAKRLKEIFGDNLIGYSYHANEIGVILKSGNPTSLELSKFKEYFPEFNFSYDQDYAEPKIEDRPTKMEIKRKESG